MRLLSAAAAPVASVSPKRMFVNAFITAMYLL
jgi:hypothetical protein